MVLYDLIGNSTVGNAALVAMPLQQFPKVLLLRLSLKKVHLTGCARSACNLYSESIVSF